MSPCTSADVIRKFAMALRGQSPDEYNAEDNHTRAGTEKQIETALQVTGFLMGTPLVPNNECADVAGPWPTLSAVHPSVSIVSDREGDRWRRDGSTSRFGDDWLLFDKKIGAWRPWEISMDRASLFAPFSELETTTKAEYPHPGLAGTTVLGPEIFTDGQVINWRGENFVRQEVAFAEGETKAERRDPDELAKRMARIWDGGWDEFDEEERDYLRRAAEMARSYFDPFTEARAEQ